MLSKFVDSVKKSEFCSCTTVRLRLYDHIGYGCTTLELWLYNYKGLSCTTAEF